MPKVYYTNDKGKTTKRGPVFTRKPGGKKFRTASDPYIGVFPRTVEVGSKEDKQDQEGSAVGRAVRSVGRAVKDAVSAEPSPKKKEEAKTPSTKTVRFRKPGSSKFNQAFGAARKAGETEFTYGGRQYNTRLKGEAPRPAAPKATASEATPNPAPTETPSIRRPNPQPVEDNTPPPMPSSSSFKQAFASAKQAGEKSFTWKGKTYNTKVK